MNDNDGRGAKENGERSERSNEMLVQGHPDLVRDVSLNFPRYRSAQKGRYSPIFTHIWMPRRLIEAALQAEDEAFSFLGWLNPRAYEFFRGGSGVSRHTTM